MLKSAAHPRTANLSLRASARLLLSKRLNTPPGSLGPPPARRGPPLVDAMLYDQAVLEEIKGPLRGFDLAARREPAKILWVNVRGTPATENLRELGAAFGLHPLALEDVLNLGQRPKVEDYGKHLFIVARALISLESPASEQVAIFVGADFVLCFQETTVDAFASMKNRLRSAEGQVRRRGADYLAYCLLDVVVDGFVPIVERIGAQLEQSEDAVLSQTAQDIVPDLLAARRELQILKRIVAALEAKLAQLRRGEYSVITAETRLYLRDCHDHALRLLDVLAGWLDASANLMDVHLALSNHQLNSVMKVLTMMSAIFIPLSFIAGVYGMNFDRLASPFNMPELGHRYGYPGVLLLMAGVVLVQLVYFRRKGWFGGRR